MQPIRGPVRCDQRTVTPDRSELLAADALPDLAAGLDVLARKHELAGLRDDGLRHRWRMAEDFAAHPQQHAKAYEEQSSETDPKSTRRRHGFPSPRTVRFAAA